MAESIGAAMLHGLVAGAAAVFPMTAVLQMRRLDAREQQRELPPQEIVHNLANKAGANPHSTDEPLVFTSIASHFGYGAMSGAAFAVLARNSPLPFGVNGALFGLGLWAVGYMGWLPAMGLHRSASRDNAARNASLIASHIVFGVAAEFGLKQLRSATESERSNLQSRRANRSDRTIQNRQQLQAHG